MLGHVGAHKAVHYASPIANPRVLLPTCVPSRTLRADGGCERGDADAKHMVFLPKAPAKGAETTLLAGLSGGWRTLAMEQVRQYHACTFV